MTGGLKLDRVAFKGSRARLQQGKDLALHMYGSSLALRMHVRQPCSCSRTVPHNAAWTRRQIHNAHARTLTGNYALNGLVGFEMNKKTVGVIGTGAIGVEACRILKVGAAACWLAVGLQYARQSRY